MRFVKLAKNVLRRREFLLVGMVLVITAVMSFLKSTFLTTPNMMSLILGLSADGFVAIGMTLILISGQIDLTVGSVQCLASVIVGALYVRGMNIWLAALLALVVCVCIGAITGTLVAKMSNMTPFIITLGMMGVIRGICYIITKGTSITVTGERIRQFRFLGGGYVGFLPMFFLLLLIAIVVAQFLLRNTKFCAKTFFIGSNVKAAELAGINVSRTKIILYMISALCAAMAGVLCTGRFGVSSPILGVNAESRAITAAVVGGTTMHGGEGMMVGTLFGLILIHFISNALVQLGVSVYWQDFASNMLLLTVLVIDSYTRTKRERSLA